MAESAVAAPAKPVGRIVAQGVTFDDYLLCYAEQYHEWVRGYVIEMSPVTLRHERIVDYVRMLLNAWLAGNPIGVLVGTPFVMRTDVAPAGRLPDLQLILNSNPGDLTETVMLGPADLCVEVVSAKSVTRDYREKLAEYEQAGVREYWLIDPFRTQALFHPAEQQRRVRAAPAGRHRQLRHTDAARSCGERTGAPAYTTAGLLCHRPSRRSHDHRMTEPPADRGTNPVENVRKCEACEAASVDRQPPSRG